MKNIILLLAGLLLMGLVGCESEADKQAQVLAQQHHLFNIQQCKAETKQADNALGDILKSNTDGGQGNHDYRAAQCMGATEHTTIEYQQAKHDDYGKVNITSTSTSNVHDIPEER
jgi:hypothetical protein